MTFNHRVILRTISVILFFEGIAMIPPAFLAISRDEQGAACSLFFTLVCCIIFGYTIYKQLSYYTLKIKTRESYFVAFSAWFIVSAVGTLPYWLSGCGYSLSESIFESVSGWTTTGAWAVDINTMPYSLILWKAISNWLGGMGLLLLTISIFPVLGVEGQKMASAEMPGPELEKMSTRMSDTAKISYSIYIAMTVVEFLLLLPSNLTPFEALINTMSTISTAGLLDLNNAIVINFTSYEKLIFTVFSLVGSINFMIYFLLYHRRWKSVFRNVELRTYLGLLTGGSLIIALSLKFTGIYDNFLSAWGNAFTQSVAFGATSGFEIGNINAWPTVSKIVLLILLFIGGCANSTSGSVKVIRFIIYFKLIMRGIYKRIHPRSIKPIMIQGKPVSAASASSVAVFMLLYFAVFIFSSIVLSLENFDMETTFSVALACITNNGTGFGAIAGGNFTIFSAFGKVYCTLLMLAGRLELYAIIILFSRSFWNSDRARS